MIVTDALLEWITYRAKLCNLGLVAQSTCDNQSQIAAGLIDRLGNLELEDLRKSHIELWMGERLQTCAPVTVRGEMNVLRQVLNWCVDEQMLAARPRMPTLSVPTTEAALPSDAAFQWVLAHVPVHHARALEFMMLTGLSPHELERVQAGDLHGDTLGIGQRADFAVKQESRKRWVPLNQTARRIWFSIAAGIAATDHPFPAVEAMQKAIRRAVEAGEQRGDTDAIRARPITPKLMRKWCASKVAGDQPEHVLQRLLGHAPGSPITRRHYVRSSDAQVAGAVESLAA